MLAKISRSTSLGVPGSSSKGAGRASGAGLPWAIIISVIVTALAAPICVASKRVCSISIPAGGLVSAVTSPTRKR